MVRRLSRIMFKDAQPRKMRGSSDEGSAVSSKLADDNHVNIQYPQTLFRPSLLAGSNQENTAVRDQSSTEKLTLFDVVGLTVVMLISTTLFFLYWFPAVLPTPTPIASNHTTVDWLSRTQSAVDSLQKWYNPTTGLWETTNWWNAANILTTLGNYALLNPSFAPEFARIAQNTFIRAPISKPRVLKVRTSTSLNTYTYPNIPDGLQAPPASTAGEGFLNWYYDDEGWWALAWLKAYDVTNNTAYRTEAAKIFFDMTKGYTATCGGLWWDKAHSANVAIANELFLAVAAGLANRVAVAQKPYYVDWVWRHWAWFRKADFFNSDLNINDGLDLKTCQNNNGTVWSYNQGVILGALVEANQTGAFQPPASAPLLYNYYVSRTVYNAFRKLLDSDGILHDVCEPECGNDGPQFKGILMRNVMQSRAFLEKSFARFDESRVVIEGNADAIWHKDRGRDDKLGLVWSGPYKEATAATQSSALDALVARLDLEINSVPGAGTGQGKDTV